MLLINLGRAAMPQYVRYDDSIETPTADEAETIAKIVQTMRTEMEKVAARDHHMVRASHAKSTGLMTGRLTVVDGLEPALAQGLFARPGQYDVLVRLAQGPGEHLSDSVSTHRGMAVKVLGVEGEMLPGHGAATQDFVFATGTAFPQSDAAAFLTAIKGIERGVGMPEMVKQAVSSTMRGLNAAVQAVGGDSPTFGFFGHTRRNPLADAYFSQAALRYGDYVAKMGLFPVSRALLAIIDETIDTGDDRDAFREAVVAFMRNHEAVFELRVQLCTDLEVMPVEDAATPWPEEQSPYRVVAVLTLPAQEAHSPARAAFFDEKLSFRPAHSLAAHRPLGSLMRARLGTYGPLAEVREAENNVVEVEPVSLADVPA